MYLFRGFFLVLFLIMGVSTVSASDTGLTVYDTEGFLFSSSEEGNIDFEVLYFFSFSCPACKDFDETESSIAEVMRESDRISYRKIPVVFKSHWAATSKLFFVLQLMGIEYEASEIFDYYHNKKRFIVDDDDVYNALSNLYGVSRVDAEPYVKSEEVNNIIEASDVISQKLGVLQTPSYFIINKNKDGYLLDRRNTANDHNLISSLLALTHPETLKILEEQKKIEELSGERSTLRE